ncbi:MAG: phosphotransferase [Polyangiaceae bacterium]
MDVDLLWVAKAIGAESARRADRIQYLWSGYGEIIRVELTGGAFETAIVKSVKPPSRVTKDQGRSHARKCRSYDVEMAWYRGRAKECDDTCRVPALLAHRASKDEWIFVLEDLDAAGFSERARDPTAVQTESCLSWLAAFHARFLFAKPDGLWESGTYWHLQTRPDELARIADEKVRASASTLDRQLREAKFRTLVHGDAKPANFCFAPRGRSVAAVDFQYVGSGCGMKDVAYFLFDETQSASAETKQLDFYFERLRGALGLGRHDNRSGEDALDIVALEDEWRALYPVAKADFYRFLAGWSRE